MIEIGDIQHQILHPQRRALADGGRLRRLQVRRPERRLGAPLAREGGQRPQHVYALPAQELEAAPHQDQIGVVGDESTRRAIVNEGARGRGNIGEGVDVRHHIVSEPTLVRAHDVEVDVVDVRPHLGERVIGDRYAELLLRFGECEPELSPKRVAHPRRPQLEHGPRRVALGKRRRVPVGRAHRIAKSVE